MKKYEIFALWGNLSNASTFKYEVLKVIKSSEFSFATGNMMIKSTLEIPAAIQLKINNICARWMNASVLARIRSLAPNAHALRSCSFVRPLARIRTCTHLDQWSADHPARKTRFERPVRDARDENRSAALYPRHRPPDVKRTGRPLSVYTRLTSVVV